MLRPRWAVPPSASKSAWLERARRGGRCRELTRDRCCLRGLKASGTIGEVFKDVDDPQLNTAVQRSWCYQPDPMLKVQFEGRPADPPFDSTSITMKPNMPFEPSKNNARVRFGRVARPTSPGPKDRSAPRRTDSSPSTSTTTRFRRPAALCTSMSE